jgi:hypothetical protein
MVLSVEDQHALIALKQFAVGAAVPLLYDAPEGVDQVGTGTLLTLDGRYFIVTAAHIFNECDPGRFAIPNGQANAELHTFGPCKLYRANETEIENEAEIDIAILELLDQSTIESAKEGWHILTLENIGTPSAEGVFVLCGYPSQRAWRTNNVIGGRPITIVTERIPSPSTAKAPVHPVLDLFFHYGLDAPDIDGETVTIVHLGGVSGASVWEYRKPSHGSLWFPGQTLRVVGVQSAFLYEKYFRAKSWDMVLQMLKQVDPALETAIDSHFSLVNQNQQV